MTELGGWVLGERLGAGGMGTVYRATRENQAAAVKVVHPGLAADEEFLRRFRREIEISRLVRGPHTARLIDFDLDGAPPWLATQLLEGPTLAQAIGRTGPLHDQAIVDVAVGMANGMVDLHAVGVIHRDIKPANVVLTANGPVLMDFGVAAAAEFTSMTATGLRMGSAGWMSPEQVEGRAVGPASDVFSWGVTVAYAATGQNPYGTGPTDALLYRITHDEPDLGTVPPSWVPVLRAALARRPEDRPTAEELLEFAKDPVSAVAALPTAAHAALAPTSLGTTYLAEPPTAPGRGRGLSRSIVVGLVVASLILLLGAGAWFLSERGRASADPAEVTPTAGAPTTGNPASSSSGGAEPTAASTSDAAPPLFARAVNPGSPRELAEVGKFFADHVQQDVRIDIDWVAHTGTLEGSERGQLDATARCFPTCKVGAIQGITVSVSGLSESEDVTFSGLASSWRMTGTFFVKSATIENGGVYQLVLRVSGTHSEPNSSPRTNDIPRLGECDVLEGSSAVEYPGHPLSVAMSRQFSPHVLLVQDILNFQRESFPSLPCVTEDGYYGAGTEAAVRQYQQLVGLDADGVVGESTWSVLMLTFEGGCPEDGC